MNGFVDLVEEALASADVSYFRRQDAAIMFRFRTAAASLIFTVAVDGNVLDVEADSGRHFDADLIPTVLAGANHWMAQHRWPRLLVRRCLDDRFEIVADCSVPLDQATTADQVTQQLVIFIKSAIDFWNSADVLDQGVTDAELSSLIKGHL